MASAVGGPVRPETVATIDSKTLLGSDYEAAAEFDPVSGRPVLLRSVVVLDDPKMTVVPHFLSEPECEHLLDLAKEYWVPSLVGEASNATAKQYRAGDLDNMRSKTRTSWSCMMRYAQDSIVQHIEHRLASITGMPISQLERLNMVRYAPGELFSEHHDGSFRPMTVFVYLNDLHEEAASECRGDTYFPLLGVSFKPRRGTAVVWSNIIPATQNEDGRMLHAGRPPATGIKYGVNCFFNIKDMRLLAPDRPEVSIEDAATVDVFDLKKSDSPADQDDEKTTETTTNSPRLVAFRLSQEPSVMAVPGFLTSDESDHLLSLLPSEGVARATASENIYQGRSKTLRHIAVGETPTVEVLEKRLAKVSGLSFNLLAPLRLVRPSTQLGFSNRGCGPKSMYVCLSDEDQIFFPRLGMKLRLHRGDLLMWPNVFWNGPDPLEELRTIRSHTAAAIGVDAFFHDGPIRDQQQHKTFVCD